MNKYPLLMAPYLRSTVWGGKAIAEKFGINSTENIGEAWEVSVQSDRESIIENGACRGMSLKDYLKSDGMNEPFPLLIKFIDAKDRLSVQVHPGAEEKELEKNELWYITDAADDAEIVYGLHDGANAEDFFNLKDCRIENLIRRVNVKTGDCFYIPSGQVHAIGAGILIAEIQQNSDTTYRIYDYGRARELHLDKASKAIKIRTDDEITAIQFEKGKEAHCIANCRYFKVFKHTGDAQIGKNKKITVLMNVGGDGELLCDGENYPFLPGNTYVIPTDCPDVKIRGSATYLEITCN